jgi:hypothetical protein
MANKELVFKLKFVDENGAIVQKTAQNITDINKSIKDLKSELENTELGSEQWNTLASDLGEAENALGKVNTATQKAKESQQTLGETLTNLPGPIGQTIKGAQALNASLMKLVLNPIGAIIAAIVLGLTALYKAFTSTKAGGEAVERVMAGLSAVMDVLRDRVLKVGGALVKFFSGDFAGAADDIRGAFSGIGEEIRGEFEEAARLKGELQSITDAERELTKSRAEQNKEIAKAKLVINDETKSYAERQAALEEVRKAEIALSKQEEVLAQRKYDAIKAQNALSDSSKEALDAEAAAFAALQQAQTASLQKQKEIFDQQKALRDKEKSEQKAAADARKAQLKEAADLELQLNLDLIESAEQRAFKELDIQREKQIEQIKLLKLGKEREAELILKVETTTELKRQKVREEGYAKSLQQISAFREFLIQQELLSQDAIITLRNAELEKQLENLQIVSEAQGITDEERLRKQREVDARLSMELKLTAKAYQRYYDTIRFEAQQTYEADVANVDGREEERKKQLDEATNFYKRELDKRLDLEKKNSEDGTISTQKFNEINEELLESKRQRETEINEFFDEYEVNREKQFKAQITNINDEEEAKQTAIKQKYTDARNKITLQEMAAEQARIDLAIQSFDVLAQLAGQETELGKALAVASTTISTYDAAQKAYASQMLILSPDAPVRAAVAAGIAIAQGLLRVQQIVKVNTEKAADGMVVGQGSGRLDNVGVMVSNGETIINSRSSKIFKPLLSAINQAGGGKRFAGGGVVGLSTQTSPETSLLNNIANISSSSPIKTYVVASDVSTTASLDRQIKSRSVL